MAYETDEQQVEALKAWWQENGAAIVVAVLIALSLVGGWRGWQAWQGSQSQHASRVYAELVERVARDDADAASTFDTLKQDYSGTPYAVLGALQEANRLVSAGDLEAAASALQYAVDEASEDDIRAVAAIRLARVLLEQGDLEQAIDALPGSVPDAFHGLIESVRGDILLAQNRPAEAKAAFERALDSETEVVNSSLLEMQIIDLSGRP